MIRFHARPFRVSGAACVPLCLSLLVAACSAPIHPVSGSRPAASAPASSEVVLIPAGPFLMGCSPSDTRCRDDEEPLHKVHLDDYSIDRFEVTNARYAACVQAGACSEPYGSSSFTRDAYYGNPEFDHFPVIYVEWEQADAFCAWEGKRLPSEAEWEKAARGGDGSRIYPWGDEWPDCTRLNYDDELNQQGGCTGDTLAVGSYPMGASPYGVMDMAGNVAEWVNDQYGGGWYQESPGENPTGPDEGGLRVLRGGSWNSDYGVVRASSRDRNFRENGGYGVGFRCVRSP